MRHFSLSGLLAISLIVFAATAPTTICRAGAPLHLRRGEAAYPIHLLMTDPTYLHRHGIDWFRSNLVPKARPAPQGHLELSAIRERPVNLNRMY